MTGSDHDDHRGHHHAHDHDDHGHEHRGGVVGVLIGLVAPHSHDAADSIDDALASSREGIRALKISLVGLGLTAVAQLVVFLLTGSVALLADTIHNFSDALTALPLWVAFVLAGRSATRRYTYGYGRAEDLAGLFIIAMIALSAVVAGWESVARLVDPRPLQHPWAVLAAGLLGFVGNEAVAAYRIRVGRRIGSAALVADGLHARTDGFTSLAVAAGAVGVVLGFPLADPLVGLLITVAILAVLRTAVRDVCRRLMDGVEPEHVDVVEDVLRASPGVVDVSGLRLRWSGHRMRGEAELVVPDHLDLQDARAVCADAVDRARRALPRLDHLTVELVARAQPVADVPPASPPV